MIFFDLKQKQSAINDHLKKLRPTVIGRVNVSTTLPLTIKRFVKTNIKQILIGEPDKLETLNKKLKRNREYIANTDLANKALESVFRYDLFSEKRKGRYDAYDLAKELGVRTCLYCNRLYTLTVATGITDKEKLTRPEFDHFIDKGSNPLLALSIYNLIPSCKVCNSSLKGAKKFDIKRYFHPYQDDYSNDYWYRFIPFDIDDILKGKNTLKVGVDTVYGDTQKTKKIKRTIKTFKLETIYSAHNEELKDLFEIRHLFSKDYFKELKVTYNKLGISNEDCYRIAFGVHYDDCDHYRRPFSKIKKDLLKELGVVNDGDR